MQIQSNMRQVSRVSAEQIFYMQQRGLGEAEAMSLCVNGFVNDLIREFPMEYSVELKRLIDLEMEGSGITAMSQSNTLSIIHAFLFLEAT